MNAAQRVEVLESKRIKDVVAAKHLEKFLASPHASESILASCRGNRPHVHVTCFRQTILKLWTVVVQG
jgi:hypothetical protein